MSCVSGVVLSVSCAEDEVSEDGPAVLFERINEWLGEKGPYELKRVEDGFGGGKHPQIFVAGGGFNAFPEDDFAAFVIELPWRWPEHVVLVIHPEHTDTRVFRPAYEPSNLDAERGDRRCDNPFWRK